DLTAEGVWVQPEPHAATTERHYPVLNSLGLQAGDRGRVRVSRINPLYIMQIYTSVSGVVATRMGLEMGSGWTWYDWKIVNQATPKPGDVCAYIL
uniref:pyocin knob domain-containing protein n=1 Tax=Salmonella enterica TaxID=28901 RepID=UPI001E3D45C7